MGRLMVLVVRTAGDPELLASAMRRIVAGIDKDQPVSDISTMEHLVWQTLATRRLNTALMAVFAASAVLLAGVGIFGVAACSVARRTKEIGIRMALGARPATVFSMVAREMLALGGAGATIGLLATTMCSRLIRGFLYGVQPGNPMVLGGVAFTVILVVAAAGLIPARRATRVDPIVALRED